MQCKRCASWKASCHRQPLISGGVWYLPSLHEVKRMVSTWETRKLEHSARPAACSVARDTLGNMYPTGRAVYDRLGSLTCCGCPFVPWQRSVASETSRSSAISSSMESMRACDLLALAATSITKKFVSTPVNLQPRTEAYYCCAVPKLLASMSLRAQSFSES